MKSVVEAKQKTLIVEGWRFLPHSYAIVNQWQLLALSRRADVDLKTVDLPIGVKRWKQQEGLFDPFEEERLRNIGTATDQDRADVTMRISFPFDFSRSRSPLTAVFGTSEHQTIRKDQLTSLEIYEQLQKQPPPKDVKAVTPSLWSAQGFYNAGFDTDQVLIVPHGVDVETFQPQPQLRDPVRDKIGIPRDAFVFFSVGGAMTGNKGMDVLFRAFAEVSRKYPQAYLLLKGIDPLYRSTAMLHENMKVLSEADREHVKTKIVYFNESLPLRAMAQLYQAADIYVTPYRAEGFNLPVLEAAASGIPVICTRGGSTDDFVTEAFARKIDSEKILASREGQPISRLEPNLDHLITLMRSAIEERSWLAGAAEAGPLHVRANYTWDHAVDILLRKLFSS